MKNCVLFLCAIMVCLSFSCSSTRRSTKNSKKNLDDAYLVKQIDKHKIEADWFSAKLRVNYEGEPQNVSGTATLRMKKDSVVWLSVKKFGLELARVQVTKDSVYVLDRINGEYTAEGLNYLAESYGLPATLGGLQDFLLGNAVFLNQPPYKVEALGPSYRLSAEDPKIDSDMWIDAASYQVKKMAFDDKANDQKVEVLLDEFGPTDDQQNFSYLRTLSINSQSIGDVEIGLKYSKVEINIPKDVKFDIPSKYTRAK